MALTGTEILYVNGVQGNGQLGATLEQCTTQQIANLATINDVVGVTLGGVNTAAFTAVSTTTLANVTGLVATVPAGTYIVDGYLSTVNNNTGGVKLSLNGGTAVASSFVADTWVYNTTTVSGEYNVTSLTSNLVAAAITATAIAINGTLTISTGGTVQLQAAQDVSNSTTLTIAVGSYLALTRLL